MSFIQRYSEIRVLLSIFQNHILDLPGLLKKDRLLEFQSCRATKTNCKQFFHCTKSFQFLCLVAKES